MFAAVARASSVSYNDAVVCYDGTALVVYE
jgi:hypothetical protein